MGKSITTVKRELCWIEHSNTWDESDYKSWIKWINTHAKTVSQYTSDCSRAYALYYQALAELFKDLTWDEVATRFQEGNNLVKTYMVNDTPYNVDLIEALENAMGEDAWDKDGDNINCVDSETEYIYKTDDETDEVED